MDFKRAEEILKSPNSITVFHNGGYVWLESLYSGSETALVTTATGQATVPINELSEL